MESRPSGQSVGSEKMREHHSRLLVPCRARSQTVFASVARQVIQAEAVRTGCERFRRLRGHLYDGLGHNMGVLFWQLNDIWPAPSWASIGQ